MTGPRKCDEYAGVTNKPDSTVRIPMQCIALASQRCSNFERKYFESTCVSARCVTNLELLCSRTIRVSDANADVRVYGIGVNTYSAYKRH